VIKKEGPTGLLMTTTEIKLHNENETRFFSIPVTDTQKQTRKVIMAKAKAASDPSTNFRVESLDEWLALQRWLELSPCRVIIPYAEALGELTLPVGVRLRRDFDALISLIKAHAFLHQANRDRADTGEILATIEDYRAARKLVWDLISEGVEATISPTIVETVKAVKRLTKRGIQATVTQLAKELNIDKSAASRRVKQAAAEQYIRNVEQKANYPADYEIGAPAPRNQPVIPTVKTLRKVLAQKTK
jgi:hypothetical protein